MSNPARPPLDSLCDHLTKRRTAILRRWRKAADAEPGQTTAHALTRGQFNDHIPEVLDAFERKLRARPGGGAAAVADRDTREEEVKHGLHRWQQGYRLPELMREWGQLQLCLFEEMESFAAAHPACDRRVIAEANRQMITLVNEAISDTDGKTYRDGAEGSKWFELFGNHEYIYWAFLYAREALEANAPGSSKGKLYYNEYVLTKKADKVLKMLAWLKGKGIDVDGVGFQSHEQLQWPAIADLQTAFDKVSAAGYKIKISELDVTVYADYATGVFDPEPEVSFSAALETTQAKRFASLFALYRKNRSIITSVTMWGISDDRTWLDNEPVVGRNDYPLLFDDGHEPKAARTAIVNF